MQTFAQKQNQRQRRVSSNLARSNKPTPEPHPRAPRILHLQRTIGNQEMQRMLQTQVEESIAGLTGMASPRFGHDFSRIPIHASGPRTVQTTQTGNGVGDGHTLEADSVTY